MTEWRGGAAIAAMAMVILVGCERANGAAAAPPAGSAVVDSVHPPAVALERFREGLRGPVERLTGGASSVESLAALWAGAVETHDTTTIRRLVIDRAEFAWLYYPASPFARGPLYQSPDLVWFRLQANSEKGITRVLRRFGGTALGFRDVECPRPPRVEGRNRIWEYCEIRREDAGATRSDQLFGGILEHEGRFKFITYSNQF